MGMQDKKPPFNPNTLIALFALRAWFRGALDRSDLSTAAGSKDARETLREIEYSFLDDVLWKRASFDKEKSTTRPPISDLLILCCTLAGHMNVAIGLKKQEALEYDKTKSLHALKSLGSEDAKDFSIQANREQLALWDNIKVHGHLRTTLGKVDILCSLLVQARQETIARDFIVDMVNNPYFDPSIVTSASFIDLSPVQLDWLSGGRTLFQSISDVYGEYLKAFMEDPAQIEWNTHVLDWARQRKITLEILRHKFSLYPRGFWVSAKNFHLEDAAAEEGYRPVETLLALAESGELEITEIRRNEEQKIELYTFSNTLYSSTSRPEKSDSDSDVQQHLNIVTDFGLKVIWIEGQKMTSSKTFHKSAIYFLWKYLLDHKGKPQAKTAIRNYVAEQTGRTDEIRGLAFEKTLENLQSKLARVAKISPKDVAEWFEETEETLFLKNLD